jgi:membrane protease YdiL (CAAX protease family)
VLTAVALIAAVAVPAGLVAWRLGGRPGGPLPTPTADAPVLMAGYLGVFVGYQVLVQVFAAVVASEPAAVRGAVGTLLTAPVVWIGWRAFRGWVSVSPRAVAVGVAGWLAVSPAVYGVNAAAESASRAAGLSPVEHPLVELFRTADPPQLAVLFAAATVATPFAEEVLFRGLLLGTLVARPHLCWFPLALGVAVAGLTADGTPFHRPAVGFAAVLMLGLFALRRWPEWLAVWATAGFFAAVHSNVWPTPVPLFGLGLALGWLTVRTGGVLAGTVLHGLFNAVSAVYLIRA